MVYSITRHNWNNIVFTRVTKPEHLSQFDIFYNLTESERKEIYGKLIMKEYKPNEVIAKVGENVKGLHLVSSGEILGSNKTSYSTNNYFGHLEVINNEKVYKHTYTATNNSYVAIITIPIDILKQKLPKVFSSLKTGSLTFGKN